MKKKEIFTLMRSYSKVDKKILVTLLRQLQKGEIKIKRIEHGLNRITTLLVITEN